MEPDSSTLSLNRLKELIDYNPDTGVFISKVTGNKVGSLDERFYVRLLIDGKRYRAGRIAWFYMTGEWPEQIDHINNIKPDDRFCNLRNVTAEQNTQNRAGWGYFPKGVGCDDRRLKKKWFACIQVNGVKIRLGTFLTMEEAAKAYREAAAVYHGEYANV